MTHDTFVPIDFQPVVIIGAARSGTNMLRSVFTQWEHVVTWPCDEINYIWRHGHARWPNDELPASRATPHVRRYIRRRFCRLAHATRGRWVVEKTCANSLRVEFVRAVLPEAKFVHLVRDGRDVVASAQRRWRAPLDPLYVLRKARFVPLGDMPYYAQRYLRHRLARLVSGDGQLPTWGPRFDGIDELVQGRSLAEVCAEQWRRCVEAATASLAKLPLTQVHTVRYEELVERPTSALGDLAGFLGLPARREHVRRVGATIVRDRLGAWRTELDAAAIAAVMKRIEPTLERWGYPTWPLAA
jgi:hypothetical protein